MKMAKIFLHTLNSLCDNNSSCSQNQDTIYLVHVKEKLWPIKHHEKNNFLYIYELKIVSLGYGPWLHA